MYTTILFTRIRTKPLFFVLKKYINVEIAKRRKTFYLDLQENFPKVLTVFELLFLYKYIISTWTVERAFRTNEYYILYRARSRVFPFFPFQLRIISALRAWENIAR